MTSRRGFLSLAASLLANTTRAASMRSPTVPDTFKEWLRSAEDSAFIRMQMRAAHIPGLSIAVIDHGDLVHTAGFGLPDIAAGRSTRALTLLALRHSIIELCDACV